MEILWFLVLGIVAGWLAGKLTKGSGFGMAGNLIVGVLGALVGGFVFRLLGLSAWGLTGQLVMATAGAVILLVLLRFVKSS